MNDKIFIFGHKNPDTDTVTSAIALSYLKNKLGFNSEPYVLGEVNLETKYVLDYFKVKVPKYLNDVKLQMKDLNYHKNYFINHHASILEAYTYMTDHNITGIPVVGDNNEFLSLITAKVIAKYLINGDYKTLKTSYDNLLKTLDAVKITKFDEEIEGNIIAAAYRSTTFMELVNLTSNDILIVGDRHSIIENAVEKGVKLIIIVGELDIKPHHLEIAKKNKVNIIKTKYDTFITAKRIGLSSYIENLITEDRMFTLDQNDYFDDFLITSSKLKFNNYPIIDKNNICKGLIRITDISEKNRKKVILVDHNEIEQSVIGLDEAEILEVVDHHKIGDISTKNPINFRNMSVGSTNTIIYKLFQENNIEIPKEIAGLMISGILSDTLVLTSPTTTKVDKEVVNNLAKIAQIDYKKYAMDMFKAGTSLKGLSKNEIVNTDLKTFHTEEYSFAVSQILTLDYEDILKEKEDYVKIISEIAENKELNFVLLAVTDIINNGSYILYTEDAKKYLGAAFNIDNLSQGYYMEGVVSRKKQIVPYLMDILK